MASVTWSDALAACTSKGGDLASIHDNTTMEQILRSSPKNAQLWIGIEENLKDDDDIGRFTWTDGSAVDYTNFVGS